MTGRCRLRKSVRLVWEHVFVENPNDKGNIAEAAIAFEAVKAGVPVFKPVAEHGRADLVFEIGDELFRVQCKWGRLEREGSVIAVGIESNRCTASGYIRTRYERGELELLAVYCGALDRCYLLPESLFVG